LYDIMANRESALRLLRDFHPGDRHAARCLERTLRLLEDTPAPFSRAQFDPGHVTASAVVLSVRGQVLLVFHPRLERWLQPGGHVEPDDSTVPAAARREVLEETGLAVPEAPAPALVGVDVHDIPAACGEPHHLHHDLTFRFVVGDVLAATGARCAWCAPEELYRFGVDAPLLRSLRRALASPF
jgi:8-oxo-dGTP pyrophosphatase MutT (NUDIX family)